MLPPKWQVRIISLAYLEGGISISATAPYFLAGQQMLLLYLLINKKVPFS